MDITNCVHCHTRVIPKADHTCPSCGRSMVDCVAGGGSPAVASAAAAGASVDEGETVEELDQRIAACERGLRTAVWWMVVPSVLATVSIMASGHLYLSSTLFIASISGLIGYVVDHRTLAKLQRRRAELPDREPPPPSF